MKWDEVQFLPGSPEAAVYLGTTYWVDSQGFRHTLESEGAMSDWAGPEFQMRKQPKKDSTEAAVQFFRAVGIDDPTPDAVEQLVDAFLPSLRIMCERGYDPTGATWRASGWRGQIQEMRKKMDRLWIRSWRRGKFDPDSARDMINYAGFYLRLGGEGEPWGNWGEPGSEGE